MQIEVGADRRRIAVRRRAGADPALLWLSGFRSVMDGLKASALDGRCAAAGRAFLRFDYSGMGLSGGDFLEGTISRWLEEAEAVAALHEGPLVAVGSSMGGWIGLRLAERAAARGRPLAGLVLIAPAPDMTDRLIRPALTPALEALLAIEGVFERPSAYEDGPYPITAMLIGDGDAHLVLDRDLVLKCPVRIVHGARDEDVPLALSRELMASLAFEDVTLTVVADGDHRLSRDGDIETIWRAVEDVLHASA